MSSISTGNSPKYCFSLRVSKVYSSAMCHWMGVSVPVARTASTCSLPISMRPFFSLMIFPFVSLYLSGVVNGSSDQSDLMRKA